MSAWCAQIARQGSRSVPVRLLLEYYVQAVPRAFWAAIDWALGQGWALSLLLVIGPSVYGIVLAFVRACKAHRSWRSAVAQTVKASTDLLPKTFLGGTVVGFGLLFMWFFINDAPEQMRLVRQEATAGVSNARKDTAQLQGQVELLKKQLASIDAKGLFAECHLVYPWKNDISPDGIYHIVTVFDSSSALSAVMAEAYVPSAERTALDQSQAIKCLITNYTEEVLLSAEIVAFIDYITTTKIDNKFEGRGVYQSKNVIATVPKIDIGPEKQFVLWFSNKSSDFINIRFISTAKANHIDGTQVVVPLAYDSRYLNLAPRSPNP
jgi:hypothetical protein